MTTYNRAESASQAAYPIARGGYPFIFSAAFVTAVFALLGLTSLALLGLFITGFICYFFRDPDRLIPYAENVIVSPADGKVIKIEALPENRFYDGPCTKISIFMSVFNVHVNRIPFSGVVQRVSYFPGKFVSANLDKAALENEHNAIFIDTDKGPVCMVQIAGLIARRIVCAVQQSDKVVKGQRMGLICFGSRVDVYLPKETVVDVSIGEKVSAGTSVLGRFS